MGRIAPDFAGLALTRALAHPMGHEAPMGAISAADVVRESATRSA